MYQVFRTPSDDSITFTLHSQAIEKLRGQSTNLTARLNRIKIDQLRMKRLAQTSQSTIGETAAWNLKQNGTQAASFLVVCDMDCYCNGLGLGIQ